ncbi:hypothetical protein [Pelobacter propionicus]|uniref:Uncharacterized protein n=1 Tax=Pelobacter propionicus (strain DSM 2379 / NBRC 103807 / OttBd1) TaxID=338966 RepID=A1AN28_PELPD|nr:hypothetical protein [Pelobacter propionicus]ABK98748.1 hypothetical protein Ppro_1124 [Pelobacter propionicus DSM 2379]
MKVRFLKEFSARTTAGGSRTVAAGTVLDLSPDKAGRLVSAGIALNLNAVMDAWREFVVSADRVYQSSPKSPVVWARHKTHLNAAQTAFDTGNMLYAVSELENALSALQSTP